MTQQSQSPLLQHISNGINTLILGAIVYLANVTVENSQLLVRLETRMDQFARQIESSESRLGKAYDTANQLQMEVGSLRQEINELKQQNNKR